MKAGTVRAISVVSFALLWEIIGRSQNTHMLPPLSKVLSAWLELLVSGQLLQALKISLQSLVLGYLLSVGLGIPLGLLMGRYRRLERFLNVYMTALLTVPMISFIPFLVIAFGLGLQSRVWIVFLFAFVYIVMNTTAGVRNVDPILTEMARSFGARERELFVKVILPAALPMIMAGVRLGMGRAILGMVTGEMISADYVVFNLHNVKERFDQARTKVDQGKIYVTTGDVLISKYNNVMMTIVKDTYRGTHDMEKGMCSTSFYKKWGEQIFKIYGGVWKRLGRKRGVAPKHGCWENLAKALKPYGVTKEDVPSPLNVFQTMAINAKTGSMRYSMTRPRTGGDMMDLRAEMDCLVGISACPEGGRGKDLRVVIYGKTG